MFLMFLVAAMGLACCIGLAIDAPALFDVGAQQKLHSKALTDWETAIGVLDESEKSGDTTKITAARAECDKLEGQVNALHSKCEAARKRNEFRRQNQAMGELATVSAAGDLHSKSARMPVEGLGTVAAEAKGDEADDHELNNEFRKFFCCLGDMSGQAYEKLSSKSDMFKKGAAGVRMPKRFAQALMPEAFQMGSGLKSKALPLISGQPGSFYATIPPEFRQDLLQYEGEPGAIFPKCFRVPTKSGNILWPKLVQGAPGVEGGAEEFAEYGYVSSAWTAEGAEFPGAEPKFVQLNLTPYELASRTELSRILLQRSAVDLEQLLGNLFRASMVHKIDEALISGDGNGKPTGVLTEPGIGLVKRCVANSIIYEDFVNIETQLPPQMLARASWVIGKNAMQMIKKIKDGFGRPLFLQNVSEGAYGSILGKPVTVTQRTSQGGVGAAVGDVMLGIWDQYVCPMEQEIVVLRSEHQKMTQGLVVYAVFTVVGGRCVQPRCFSVMDTAVDVTGEGSVEPHA